ncbi:MAG: Tim44/TimA family putative adaptor protein [Holosporales bacterium]|nr:Tim44/TimA family putative adaptor protein [Holosporales bacterium]
MRVIFFAFLTGFLLFQLYAVLGKEGGSRSVRSQKKKQAQWRRAFKETVHLSPSQKASKGKASSLASSDEVSEAFLRAYPSFRAEPFLKGAEAAFACVQEAYMTHDLARLKELLTPELFQVFQEQITGSIQRGETLERPFFELKSSTLKKAVFQGDILYATVEFVSKQCLVVKDAQKKIILGSQDLIKTTLDSWTFSRHASARSSKWLLADTKEHDPTCLLPT